MATTSPVRIDVWSDFVCPFCVLEEPVLDEIKQEFGKGVEIVWRAFELRPEPHPTLQPDGEYLKNTWARAVYPMAEARGMPLRLPPVQPRSRLAHEAARHAHREGQGDAMRRAIFRAFFEEGRDIGDIDVLLDIGVSNGLDAASLRAALEHGVETAGVHEDQQEAAAIGVRGVPAMVVRRTDTDTPTALLVSGAQPAEVLRSAVAQARQA